VLKLTNVVSERLFSAGHVSMDLFRKGLDRPKAKVPKLRYYFLAFMLGPGMVPYKIALSLAMLFRPKSGKKLSPKVDLMLEHYCLGVEEVPDDPRWATISSRGRTVAEKILNPRHVSASSSLFFHTYKVLFAVFLAILVTSFAIPSLPRIHPVFVTYPGLSFLLYPMLFLGLYLMLRDLWTAFLAPLPLLVARWMFSVSGGVTSFILAMAGVAVLFYLVEWFFIPRSTPPSLYLYVNDPEHEMYPYRPGHEPYWLEGKYYWVWRFVVLAPAEITKFWEKDWERLEVWVRADPGPHAGKLEWLVTDTHYRELWFRYERETTEGQRSRHGELLRRSMSEGGYPFSWIVEFDLNFLFHTPDVRGVFAAPSKNGKVRWSIWRIFRALGDHSGRDRFADYREILEEMEAEGEDFAADVPEHFQALFLRQLIGLPWIFWRYPKGAGTSAKVPAYNPAAVLSLKEELASDRRYQIKAFKAEGE
jgi:hypothetical protein